MRKILDFIFKFLLKVASAYLYRYYDLFFDGIEVWISEKIPSLGDTLEEFEDFFEE